jgi:NAD(P)H-dependent FMN reductase
MTPTADEAPLQVAVIIGSTREGRVGDRVGRWFATRAAQRGDLAVTVLDLADFDLPAGYPGARTPHVERFAAEIGRADAFVLVTPEYNHSFPASLKLAIDHAYDEWHAKPVGFVSYGCRSEGTHAVDQLRTVFTALHAVTMRDGVGFDLLTGTGQLVATDPSAADGLGPAVATLLDQLRWWGLALRDARAARPYIR